MVRQKKGHKLKVYCSQYRRPHILSLISEYCPDMRTRCSRLGSEKIGWNLIRETVPGETKKLGFFEKLIKYFHLAMPPCDITVVTASSRPVTKEPQRSTNAFVTWKAIECIQICVNDVTSRHDKTARSRIPHLSFRITLTWISFLLPRKASMVEELQLTLEIVSFVWRLWGRLGMHSQDHINYRTVKEYIWPSTIRTTYYSRAKISYRPKHISMFDTR